MKALVTIFILLGMFSANALADLGQKIEFYSVNKKPQFGVQMAQGTFVLNFTLDGYDLAQNTPVTGVAVKLVNKNSGADLSQWLQVYVSPNGAVIHGPQAYSVSFSGQMADQANQSLRSEIILISASSSGRQVSSSYVDLSSYCESAAGSFINLDTFNTGCPK